MSNPTHPTSGTGHPGQPDPKLMVSGYVCPAGGCALTREVKRGMLIFSSEGREVGKVAAILLSAENRQATHILLSRLPQECGYWLVPLDMIGDIDAEGVRLMVAEEAVKALSRWHSF